jgi:hypothetical protein
MASLVAVILRLLLEVIKLIAVLVKSVFKLLNAMGLLIPALTAIAYFFGLITFMEIKWNPVFRTAHMKEVWISTAVVFGAACILRFTLKPLINHSREKKANALIKAQLMLARKLNYDLNSSQYKLQPNGYFTHTQTGRCFADDMESAMNALNTAPATESDEMSEPALRGGYADEYIPEIAPDLYTAEEADLLFNAQVDLSLPDDIYA